MLYCVSSAEAIAVPDIMRGLYGWVTREQRRGREQKDVRHRCCLLQVSSLGDDRQQGHALSLWSYCYHNRLQTVMVSVDAGDRSGEGVRIIRGLLNQWHCTGDVFDYVHSLCGLRHGWKKTLRRCLQSRLTTLVWWLSRCLKVSRHWLRLSFKQTVLMWITDKKNSLQNSAVALNSK